MAHGRLVGDIMQEVGAEEDNKQGEGGNGFRKVKPEEFSKEEKPEGEVKDTAEDQGDLVRSRKP